MLLGIGLWACQQENNHLLIGAKIYEYQGSFEELFTQWEELGFNTAFCSQDLLSSPEFRINAAKHGVATFLIFPVFFNPDTLAVSPELAAIDQYGHQAAEEWVEFVCPSDSAYRMEVTAKARKVVRRYQPAGISMDFIRHFVYWEKVYPDRDPATLPITCFCPSCLRSFQEKTGIRIPDSLDGTALQAQWLLQEQAEAWRSWRIELINEMVEAVASAVREEKEDILVNVHLVPWMQADFDGMATMVTGQDVRTLAKKADILSPMCYAHMVRQEPPWIHQVTEDIHLHSGIPVLPSIQAEKAYLDVDLEPDEFKYSLQEALKEPSSGVIIWSWESLAGNPAKLEIVKDVLSRVPGSRQGPVTQVPGP